MLKTKLLSLGTAGVLISSPVPAGPDQDSAQCRPSQINGRWAIYVLPESVRSECFIHVRRGRFTGTCMIAGFEGGTSGTLKLTRSCDLSGRFGGPEGGILDGTLHPDGQSGAALLNNRQSEKTQSGLMPQVLMQFVRK